MKARPLVNRRVILTPRVFAEQVIWEVLAALAGSSHWLKYRLARALSFRHPGVAPTTDREHAALVLCLRCATEKTECMVIRAKSLGYAQSAVTTPEGGQDTKKAANPLD